MAINTTTDRYAIHTRTRRGVYHLVGTAPTSAKAFRLMADIVWIEVTKGIEAKVWISCEGEKIYEWDHEHDTLADAQSAAGFAL